EPARLEHRHSFLKRGTSLALATGAIAKIDESAQRLGVAFRKPRRSEEHTSELQSPYDLVCRLLLEKKNNNLIPRNQTAAFSSGKVIPNHETNINIIARRTVKDVNSHTVLDGIITTIMATIQRINIIGSREGSRNRRRLKANQTGKKFRVGIKSNISTNRNNLISGVDRCIHLNAMKKTTITSINRQTIKI